jgi:hypothetical protein
MLKFFLSKGIFSKNKDKLAASFFREAENGLQTATSPNLLTRGYFHSFN